jgi:hypothetical protein
VNFGRRRVPESCCQPARTSGEENRKMPEKRTMQRARVAAAEGKAPSTQAGNFVREEIEHVRGGKHGARSPRQAIAIGLSKARRSGVDLPPPKRGRTAARTRRSAERAYEQGQGPKTSRAPSPRRKRAVTRALKREGQGAVASEALSRQTRSASARRSPAERSTAARKASRTKGPRVRRAAAKKAARKRSRS